MSSPAKNHRTNGTKGKTKARGPAMTETAALEERLRKEKEEAEHQKEQLEATIRLLEAKNAELREALTTSKATSLSGSSSPAPSPSNGRVERANPRTKAAPLDVRYPRPAPDLRALQAIRLRQSSGFVEKLSPGEPFFVQTRLRLPDAPSKRGLEIDGGSYEVRVVVRDMKGEESAVTAGAAEDLTIGVLDYESIVPMPALEPGTYSLSVYAIVPFARVGERKTRTVVVGG